MVKFLYYVLKYQHLNLINKITIRTRRMACTDEILDDEINIGSRLHAGKGDVLK